MKRRLHVGIKGAIALAVVAVILIGLRLALPGWARDEVNARLKTMGAYSGHIDEVDLHLWRGAYSATNLAIWKSSDKVPAPLVQAPVTDISLSWRDLFHGAIVATATFQKPEINLVDGKSDADTQAGGGVDWRAQLEQFIPIKLDEVRVEDGTLRFRNFKSQPQVDVRATKVQLVIQNLTNVRDSKKQRPASLEATAMVLGEAPLEAHAQFDPFTGLNDAALEVRIDKIDLVRLNNLLAAYLYLDVAAGHGELVTELDIHDRQLTGYIKPLFSDIKVVDWKKDFGRDNPVKLAWKALAGGLVAVFKNHPADQFGTRVQLSGSLDAPHMSTLEALAAIFHNAFVKALAPGFEGGKAER